MEEEVVNIFNWNDPSDPFFALSPAFVKNVLIDGRFYRSPLNYIYAQLLRDPENKSKILSFPNMLTLHKETEKLLEKERDRMMFTAVKKAVNSKFLIPQYFEKLMKTGDAELIYRSENTDLGINESGVGKNQLGKLMMLFRDSATIDFIDLFESQYFKKLAEVYNIYKSFEVLIKNNKDDLGRFTRMIAKDYKPTLEKEHKYIAEMDGETIRKIFAANQQDALIPKAVFVEMEIPESMIHMIRAENLQNYIQTISETIKRNLLFQFFKNIIFQTDSPTRAKVLETRFKDSKLIMDQIQEEAYKKTFEELQKLSEDEQNDLKERLLVLYKALRHEVLPDFGFRAIDIDIPALEDDLNITKLKVRDILERFARTQQPRRPVQVGDVRSTVAAIRKLLNHPNKSTQALVSDLLLRGESAITEAQKASIIDRKKRKLRNTIYRDWMKLLEVTDTHQNLEDTLGLVEKDSSRPVIMFSRTPDANPEEFRFLSPECMDYLFTVGSLRYPSITHYCVAYILSQNKINVDGLLIENIYRAHEFLLTTPGSPDDISSYKPVDEVMQQFSKIMNDNYQATMIESSIKANNMKFGGDLNLQALLLATGRAKITYQDYDDSVLGVGPDGAGENAIGVILQDIRTKSEGKVAPTVIIIPPTPDLNELMMKSETLKNWFNMRLKDAITSIKNCMVYFYGEIPLVMSPAVTDFVLHRLYYNCMSIYEKNAPVQSIPEEFKRNVFSLSTPIRTIPDSVYVMLWRYMRYLLSSFMDVIKAKAGEYPDIDSIINEVLTDPMIVSEGNFDCSGLFNNPIKNCIMKAILNILHRLSSFEERPLDDFQATIVMHLIAPVQEWDFTALQSDNLEREIVLKNLKKLSKSIPIEDEAVATVFANFINAIYTIISNREDSREKFIIASRVSFFS